ncbi:MAG: hypothetical protein V8Q32_08070 [Anaerotignum faecicola]
MSLTVLAAAREVEKSQSLKIGGYRKACLQTVL